MKNTIVCFDTETTGLRKDQDWIIQLAATKFNTATYEIIEELNVMLIPPVSNDLWDIPADAAEVHGITKEEVITKGIPMAEGINRFIKLVEGSDLMGYNTKGFDLEFLVRNAIKCNINFEAEKFQMIDVMKIEQKINSNKLTEVYKRYYGEEFESAHDALADVHATIDVYKKQLGYEVAQEYISNVENLEIISCDNTLFKKDGVYHTIMKEHRDKPVYKVWEVAPTYYPYFFKKGMLPQNIKMIEDIRSIPTLIQWTEEPFFGSGDYSGFKVVDVMIKDIAYITWMAKNGLPENQVVGLRNIYTKLIKK